MKKLLSRTSIVAGLAVATLFVQPATAQTAEEHAQKIADIRRMMDLTGTSKLTQQIMATMAANYKDPKQQEFYAQVAKEADFSRELFDLMIPIYDKYYTHEDIKAIIGFYESPAGQKMLSVLPQITQEMMPKAMEWGQDVGRRVMEKMKAKGQ